MEILSRSIINAIQRSHWRLRLISISLNDTRHGLFSVLRQGRDGVLLTRAVSTFFSLVAITCGCSSSGKLEANLLQSERMKNMSVVLYYYFPPSLFPVPRAWVCIKKHLSNFLLTCPCIYIYITTCVCFLSLTDTTRTQTTSLSENSLD